MANHVYWEQFIAHLRKLVNQNEKVFVFHVVSRIAKGKPIESKCKIAISVDVVSAIDRFGAYSPTCYPVPEISNSARP